jgi:osmotically-inducible protein OsmY
MSQSTALVVPSGPLAQAPEREDQPATALAQGLVDLCLIERVERAIHATGLPPLRAVEVCVGGQQVVLKGHVPSYYMKQLAQAAAMDVAGVRELRNELQVGRS